MAVPEVTTVFPPTGPTGGRRLVQIMGQNFQLAPDPPATGVVPVPSPSVEVLFGGAAGSRVAVTSTSRLFVVTPRTPLPASSPDGAVDIEVRNIAQDGDLVPGETVTVAGGYTYELPDINAQPEPDLTRVCRTLIHELKRQILGNVNLTVDTDYSDAPATRIAYLAELPAIVLFGPDFRENRFYSRNQDRELDNTFGLGEKFSEILRPPYTVDLLFRVLGASDRKIQNVNLQAEVASFMHRNKTVSMLRDPSDASKGSAEWEMDWEPGGHLATVGSPNNSNVRAFQGRFAIRGFDFDDASMAAVVTRELEDQLAQGSVVGPSAVLIGEPEQLGTSYATGRSPGGDT